CSLARAYSLYYFTGYGNLQQQHSFPTRRSSDLADGPGTRVTLVLQLLGAHLHLLAFGFQAFIFGTREVEAALLQVGDDGVEIGRSEEHTSELQSRENLVCRLLLE